ncbi:hypothetical protein AmDm5_1572 [Acetobacter malorum]|nr:hypothetical protein AmDm5_1572 [Acetobacter malorum]
MFVVATFILDPRISFHSVLIIVKILHVFLNGIFGFILVYF